MVAVSLVLLLYYICCKVASAYRDCNDVLFELLLPSYQIKAVWLFSSDLWYQQGTFAQTVATDWIFSLLQTCWFLQTLEMLI